MLKKTVLASLILAAGAAWAGNIPLTYPGNGYPDLLGVSCGGVRVSTYATGFDPSGNITGEIKATTRCGGSGRGGGYRTVTYTSWHSALWGITGTFIQLLPYDGIYPDISWVETDLFGNTISTVCCYTGVLTTP